MQIKRIIWILLLFPTIAYTEPAFRIIESYYGPKIEYIQDIISNSPVEYERYWEFDNGERVLLETSFGTVNQAYQKAVYEWVMFWIQLIQTLFKGS